MKKQSVVSRRATIGLIWLLAFMWTQNTSAQTLTPNSSIRLINNSSRAICAVYISLSSDTTRGINRLESHGILLPGEVYIFDLEPGKYSIQLFDCTGNTLLDGDLTVTGQYDLYYTDDLSCFSIHEMGKSLYQQSQYEDALERFYAALVCYQDIGDKSSEGTTRNNIGGVYYALGRYTNALDEFQKALSLAEETGDLLSEGAALNNIGLIYEDQGHHADALEYFSRSLEIRRTIGDQNGEAYNLNNIGNVYDHQGNYADALDMYQKALLIARNVQNRSLEETIINNIGTLYTAQGRNSKALNELQQALNICKEMGDRKCEGEVLNNIGAVYHYQGDYSNALSTYQQALGTIQTIGGRVGEGAALQNIGVIYANQGRYADALDIYQQALVIFRDTGDKLGEARTIYNLGIMYAKLGRNTDALDAYQQSFAIAKEINDQVLEAEIASLLAEYGNMDFSGLLKIYQDAVSQYQETGDLNGEINTLIKIGNLYLNHNDNEKALIVFKEALDKAQEMGSKSFEESVLSNIGTVYLSQDQFDDALNVFQQALTIDRKSNDRVAMGVEFNNIGEVYYAQRQYEQALEAYQQAMDNFESVRSTAGSDMSRAAFIAQYTSLYDRALELYFQWNQPEQAFLTSERGRARAFLDSMATGYVDLNDNKVAALYIQEQETYAAHQSAQDALAKAKAQNPPDEKLVADLETQLVQTENDHQVALDAISARGNQLEQLVPGRSKVLDVSQAQALLDGQTTLLSFWVLNEQTLVFVLTQRTFNIVALPIARKDLYGQIQTFRSFANTDDAYPESAVILYRALIEPLKSQLATLNLIIIPQGELHYLPFAALTDGSQYLVDEYNISYLPSVSALPFIRENIQTKKGQTLFIGNPTTGDTKLAPLLFSEKEVQGIASLYNVNPLIRSAATESKVKELVSQTGILHLAAHGNYNSTAPLYSSIALAPDEQNDGLLEVHEIYGLDLRQTNLVVLSACETQLGELSRGDELVGLTRAFFFAGTPTVVASLWSVDDEATAMLMERFYTHMKEGLGKAEALRQAQLDVRTKYPNPYYWAGFVLSGDGKKFTDSYSTPLPWVILIFIVCGCLIGGFLWFRRRK